MSGVRTAVEKSRSGDAAASEPRSRRPARAPEGSIASMVPRLFSRGNERCGAGGKVVHQLQ